MSAHSRAPAHQNTFAFMHNKNSKKTKAIASMPNVGVCKRCHDIIEWRKKYRKYKPLTKPGKCADCHLPKIKAAYHTLCPACANVKEVCPKCLQHKDIWGKEEEAISELIDEIEYLRDTRGQIAGMPERERRSLIRELTKEVRAGGKAAAEPSLPAVETVASDEGDTDNNDEAGDEEEDDEYAERMASAAVDAAAAGAGGSAAPIHLSHLGEPRRSAAAPASALAPASGASGASDHAESGGAAAADALSSLDDALRDSDAVNSVLVGALAAARCKREAMEVAACAGSGAANKR